MLSPWRLIVRDRFSGQTVSNITAIARGKNGRSLLNRASTLGFIVPADHPAVWHPAADGLPKIEEGIRSVHLLHYEPVPPWGEYAYVPRFSGIVWSLEDSGDENGAETIVSCVSPFHLYTKRPVMNDDGTTAVVDFTNLPGEGIVAALHNRTVNHYGSVGLVLGTLEATPVRAQRWDNAHDLATALTEMAGSFNGFDLEEEPLSGETPGQIARLHVRARLGQKRPFKIGWGVPPHNARSVSRKKTMETVANDLTITGGQDWLKRERESAGSIAKYGRILGSDAIEDVTVPEFMDVLADEQIALRALPFESVSFSPTIRVAPWDDVSLGDTFDVEASERLRGGFKGVQRCYGFAYEILDGSGEASISELIVKEEA